MWHCVISWGVIACKLASNCLKYYHLWYAVIFACCYWEKKCEIQRFPFSPSFDRQRFWITSRRLTVTRGGGVANNWRWLCICVSSRAGIMFKRTDPRPAVRLAEGPNSFHWKKREVGSFILLHKISRTACCFRIRTFLRQYNFYESANIWYTDHQYLAQYSEIINNLQEIPLIFCNYAVRSCGTWRKGPGQSPCTVLSISDLKLYVTETSTGVCDPVTD